MKPHKWSYLREQVIQNNATKQELGKFKITEGIEKPKDVFIWILDAANLNSQTGNPYLFNIFNVNVNNKLDSCYLEVGDERQYLRKLYKPSTNPMRVLRNASRYSYRENNYGHGGTLLNY